MRNTNVQKNVLLLNFLTLLTSSNRIFGFFFYLHLHSFIELVVQFKTKRFLSFLWFSNTKNCCNELWSSKFSASISSVLFKNPFYHFLYPKNWFLEKKLFLFFWCIASVFRSDIEGIIYGVETERVCLVWLVKNGPTFIKVPTLPWRLHRQPETTSRFAREILNALLWAKEHPLWVRHTCQNKFPSSGRAAKHKQTFGKLILCEGCGARFIYFIGF